MALGAITITRYIQPRRGVRERVFSMVGTGSYTATGDAVTAATFKLNSIDDIQFDPSHTATTIHDSQFVYNKTTGKIQAIVPSTGVEVAGAVNLSTVTVRGRAIGY